jgi:hypothetical protein
VLAQAAGPALVSAPSPTALLVAVLRAAGLSRPAETAAGRPPRIASRMIANPSPRSAFAVGLLVFAPGVTFLAALEVIATAQASIELTTLAIVIAVVITRLAAVHGVAVLAAAMIVAGAIIAATASAA